MRAYGLARLIDEMLEDIYRPETSSWTYKGQWVDTDRFDVTPKKSYQETLIRRKQEEIEALERQQESNTKYYEEKKRRLAEEKERLLRDRDNKNKDG
jgi:hypothetical protein